ncbi:hypothetical protein [Sulfurimonas sp.]
MKKGDYTIGVFLSVVFGVGLTLFLTYDIIITNILSAYYCNTAPNPKTYIGKKVEYPISIYWEDNVYPGFSKADRELMIINYLDGVHLKTMALNGDDGKIYVYHLDRYIWDTFKQEFAEKFGKNPKKIPPNKENHFLGSVYNVYDAYADKIMKTEKIYTKQSMPKLNYTVTFNEVPLNSFARKFLYSDETKVIENNTSRVIAYNRRYMRFYYTLQPDFQGGNYYYVEPICGKRIDMEQEVFDSYGWTSLHLGNHSRNLDKILINRYIKGEK